MPRKLPPSSRLLGIHRRGDTGRYTVRLGHRHLGTFVDEAEAIRARLTAEKEEYGVQAHREGLFREFGMFP